MYVYVCVCVQICMYLYLYLYLHSETSVFSVLSRHKCPNTLMQATLFNPPALLFTCTAIYPHKTLGYSICNKSRWDCTSVPLSLGSRKGGEGGTKIVGQCLVHSPPLSDLYLTIRIVRLSDLYLTIQHFWLVRLSDLYGLSCNLFREEKS